jgi:hypothetical protein
MTLQLSPREAEVLLRALDSYLPELEFELARVKLERHRRDLNDLDNTLRRLRDRIAEAANAPELRAD